MKIIVAICSLFILAGLLGILVYRYAELPSSGARELFSKNKNEMRTSISQEQQTGLSVRRKSDLERSREIRFLMFCDKAYEDDWISRHLEGISSSSDLSGLENLCSTVAKEALLSGEGLPTTITSHRRVNTSRDNAALFYSDGMEISYTYSPPAESIVDEVVVRLTGDDNNHSSGPERADVMFFAGHGFPGKLALWNKGHFALGNRMRLGDGDRPLSILALWSCNSLSLNADIPGDSPLKKLPDYESNDMWALWGSTIQGGLKAVLGSASKLESKPEESYHIRSFVRSLRRGDSLASAWLNHAQPAPYSDNLPRVLFSGRDDTDCLKRLEEMSLSNFRQFPILRDDDVKVLCWRTRVGDELVDSVSQQPIRH